MLTAAGRKQGTLPTTGPWIEAQLHRSCQQPTLWCKHQALPYTSCMPDSRATLTDKHQASHKVCLFQKPRERAPGHTDVGVGKLMGSAMKGLALLGWDQGLTTRGIHLPAGRPAGNSAPTSPRHTAPRHCNPEPALAAPPTNRPPRHSSQHLLQRTAPGSGVARFLLLVPAWPAGCVARTSTRVQPLGRDRATWSIMGEHIGYVSWLGQCVPSSSRAWQ
jgi:hypothetical protein